MSQGGWEIRKQGGELEVPGVTFEKDTLLLSLALGPQDPEGVLGPVVIESGGRQVAQLGESKS